MFAGSLIYLFTVLYNMFLTDVIHEVSNLESSVVVQEMFHIYFNTFENAFFIFFLVILDNI